MQDDFFDDGNSGPLTGAALVEFQTIMRYATIWELKDRADEVARMHRSLLPTPTLDELPTLDTEPCTREQQLLLLWLVERRFRQKLQANLRRSLEMLAG